MMQIPNPLKSKIINSEASFNYTFKSRLSSVYPYLPIHMYSQNLSLLRNKSKLILVGNAFFGDRTWKIFKKTDTLKETMNSLLCPFLTDYCQITIDSNEFSKADAVVYHIRDNFDFNFANVNRKPHQRFVFTLWESPTHTPNLHKFKHFFNWTMTYRFHSDIIASYYSRYAYVHHTTRLHHLMLTTDSTINSNFYASKITPQQSDEIFAKKKLGTAAALISNCGASSNRISFIHALQKYIDVKIYGRCGEACPRNRDCREFIAENFYYFLSFENSLCTEYTSKKHFQIEVIYN